MRCLVCLFILLLAVVEACGRGSTDGPPLPVRWNASIHVWDMVPHPETNSLYVIGQALQTTSFDPTPLAISVFDLETGRRLQHYVLPQHKASSSLQFSIGFIVAPDGDVIIRRGIIDSTYSQTATALVRYNLSSGKEVWRNPSSVNTQATGPTGVLYGDYVYTYVGMNVSVINLTSGVTLNTFSVAPIGSSYPSLHGVPLLAVGGSLAGRSNATLVIDDSDFLQGYALDENPALPHLAWTGERAVSEAARETVCSNGGRWVLALDRNANGELLVLDSVTGAMRRFVDKRPLTLYAATDELAFISTVSRHHHTVMTTYMALNLTSFTFVEHTRPHVPGSVWCGLSTDAAVVVCTVQKYNPSSDTSLPVGLTVFDARTGAVAAEYDPSQLNIPMSIDQISDDWSPMVAPSADGIWYNVILRGDLLTMTQIPRQ